MNFSNLEHEFVELRDRGYAIDSQLGCNRAAGRVTYKAIALASQKNVVIKQFRFLDRGDWSDYKVVDREISVLKDLNHPNIPQYKDSFSTQRGLCLVQEYIDAPCLNPTFGYSRTEILSIARQTLDILCYLQSQNPIVVHRDIKPENLLWSQEEKLYLIDFGLAKASEESHHAASSILVGTIGFMPPEQLLGRTASASSDLYSLGITLCCLLLRKPSRSIADCLDERFRFPFPYHLLEKWDRGLLDWVEKLVKPESERRYANAREAKEALSRVSRLATDSEEITNNGLSDRLIHKSNSYRLPILNQTGTLAQERPIVRLTSICCGIGALAFSIGTAIINPQAQFCLFPFTFFEPELANALNATGASRIIIGASFGVIRSLFFCAVGLVVARKMIGEESNDSELADEAIAIILAFSLAISGLEIGALMNRLQRTTAPPSINVITPSQSSPLFPSEFPNK